MRIILIALFVAVLAIPAQAQWMKGKPRTDAGQPQSAELRKKKARDEEKAAKSALERLPDRPFDPWRNSR